MSSNSPWSARRIGKDSFFGSSQQPAPRTTATAGAVTAEIVHQIVARPLDGIVNSLGKAAAAQRTPANTAGHTMSQSLAATIQQQIHPTSNATMDNKAAESAKPEPESEVQRPTI